MFYAVNYITKNDNNMQNKTLKTGKHIQQQPENTVLLLWIESRKVAGTPNGLNQERKQQIPIS